MSRTLLKGQGVSMSLDLQLVREIASQVAREQHEQLQVVGVRASGEYAEILLSLNDCTIDPCRVMLGVLRDTDPRSLRSSIADSLHRHLASRK
jgi:hypothetical protein